MTTGNRRSACAFSSAHHWLTSLGQCELSPEEALHEIKREKASRGRDDGVRLGNRCSNAGGCECPQRQTPSSGAPPPPPSIGYFGYFPIELDYAQAQAWSLSRPYYTHFMYNYCDYRNCVLRRNDKGELAPVWFGPVN